ncbi:MAG: hypothetical protein Kow00117_07920 [Phototrophicales bacterium]
MTIYYGEFSTTLGTVLMAATKRGLSLVWLCHSDKPIAAQLTEMQSEHPQAKWVKDSDILQEYVTQLQDFLSGHCTDFCPRLDVLKGTTFQRDVWDTLRQLPAGTTITYQELAERINRPKATRAVANACGSNVLAIAIPCHRVIRHDGILTGYRWGIAWKKRLLAIESNIPYQQALF